jgi:hypothetical protein
MFHQNVGTHLQGHHCENLKYQKEYFFLVKLAGKSCKGIMFGEWRRILYLLEGM